MVPNKGRSLRATANKHLLISDLDGTLIGDEEALAAFSEWIRTCAASLTLVYATGRTYDSVVDEIRTTALPEPAAIIGFVGTDIHEYPSGRLIEAWHRKINRKWDAGKVRSILSSHGELELQPSQFQSDFKVSYYLPDASGDDIRNLREEVAENSIEAEVIYSSNRDLDFLPLRANKGKASAFLASEWGIARDRVVVCGDTGNDMALFEQGFRGVVVGNAQPDLKSLAGPNVYHAEGLYARGVLEGVDHWWGNL